MATLTTEDFSEALPSELSLFSVPPSQTAVEKTYFQGVRSTSHVNGSAPMEFIIIGQNGMEFLDHKHSKLYIKVRILHSDGKTLDVSTLKVGPTNPLFYSMFSQVDVSLQGKLITSTTSHYPYKVMIHTLLNYGTNANASQLTSIMWVKDTPGHMDDADIENTSNYGLSRRYLQGSKSVDMEGPILHDLFQLDRFLLNQAAVSVKLYRTRPDFCLMSNEPTPSYQVAIEDIVLKACKVQVNRSLYMVKQKS